MNLTEQTEEALEEEKAATNEVPKTWNTAEVYWFRIFLNLFLSLIFFSF